MKYSFTLLAIILCTIITYAQEINAEELLNKSISYHDPEDNWSTFNGSLKPFLVIS